MARKGRESGNWTLAHSFSTWIFYHGPSPVEQIGWRGRAEGRDRLARIAGLDPTNFAVEYGVSTERQQIAFCCVSRETAGAAPVRRDMERQTTTLYLKPVFKKHASLQVKVRKQCALVLTKDKNGEDCLVLSLGTGLDKPVARRRSTGA